MQSRIAHVTLRFLASIVLVSFYQSCLLAQAALDQEFELLNGSSSTLKASPARAYVLIFFSESCPICQKYMPTLLRLQKSYQTKDIRFLLVFPDITTRATALDSFRTKYHCSLECVIDNHHALCTSLAARVTPEAFVVDSIGQTIYRGRIDNWFVAPGRMRSIISSHELEQSIEALLQQRKPDITKTAAIGCLIENPSSSK